MEDASLALFLARGRIAIGVATVAAPRLASRAISGKQATGVEPVFARMIGAREIALGLGIVVALDRGAPVRGWLEAAALADTADCIASLLGRRRMGPRAFVWTLVIASTAAVSEFVVARRLDPAPPAHPGQPEAIITGHPE